jgi:hypothetical protein
MMDMGGELGDLISSVLGPGRGTHGEHREVTSYYKIHAFTPPHFH